MSSIREDFEYMQEEDHLTELCEKIQKIISNKEDNTNKGKSIHFYYANREDTNLKIDTLNKKLKEIEYQCVRYKYNRKCEKAHELAENKHNSTVAEYKKTTSKTTVFCNELSAYYHINHKGIDSALAIVLFIIFFKKIKSFFLKGINFLLDKQLSKKEILTSSLIMSFVIFIISFVFSFICGDNDSYYSSSDCLFCKYTYEKMQNMFLRRLNESFCKSAFLSFIAFVPILITHCFIKIPSTRAFINCFIKIPSTRAFIKSSIKLIGFVITFAVITILYSDVYHRNDLGYAIMATTFLVLIAYVLFIKPESEK